MKKAVSVTFLFLIVVLIYWFGVRQIYYFNVEEEVSNSVCECIGPEVAIYGESECIGIPKPCHMPKIDSQFGY